MQNTDSEVKKVLVSSSSDDEYTNESTDDSNSSDQLHNKHNKQDIGNFPSNRSPFSNTLQPGRGNHDCHTCGQCKGSGIQLSSTRR